MSNTQLTYAVTSNPDPLQASPQQGAAPPATLIIVVSNNTHRMINCTSISFAFLQGTNAKDLFSDATGISTTSQPGWSLNQSGNLFTATPDTPAYGKIGAQGLTFVLSNISVNAQPGTTNMTITDNTGSIVIPLAKFPAQFEVGDLNADPLIVDQGGDTILSWSGTSGATYELQYEDSDGNTVTITHPKGEPDQPLPSIGSYTVENLQTNPTTFYLVVTYPVPGFGSLTIQRECTVTISAVTIEAFDALPVSVGKNGLIRLSWRTNADSCVLDPGHQVVEPNGHAYRVVPETQSFTLTAIGQHSGPLPPQLQRTVTVDLSIVPTPGLEIVNAGAPGPNGSPGPSGGEPGMPGGDGGNGENATNGDDLVTTLPALDTSSSPARVYRILNQGGSGGHGGSGGDGGEPGNQGPGGQGGDGGDGGNAGNVNVIFDSSQEPAQYIIDNLAGPGGKGGAGGSGNPPGGRGNDGKDGKLGQLSFQDE